MATAAKRKKSGKKSSKKKSQKLLSTGHYEDPATLEANLDEDDDLDSHDRYMTLGDHLEELRKRIMWALGVIIIAGIIAFIAHEPLHIFLSEPYRSETDGLSMLLGTVYGPLEAMLKLSFLTGFVTSIPITIFILWGFITPAVERKVAFLGNLSVALSALLFWGGMAFSWFFVFPIALQFMFTDFLPAGVIPQVTLEKYYSFLFMLHLGAGLLFQLPLILIALGALGILPISWHKRFWKHILVTTFLLSALFTPPDPFSQVLFAMPLIVLYIIAVSVVWIIERIRRRRDEREEAATAT